MANRKSKSGGQSQGPKQPAGGGASRPSNAQATNKSRSGGGTTAHPQNTGNGSSKPQASSAAAPRAPKAQSQPQPQPHVTAQRPSNGTKHSNANNAAAPKPQGANGSNIVRGEAISGNRASQDRAVNQGTTSKRNGLNNGTQKAQGSSTQPNVSPKNEAAKPKQSQGFFGNYFSAPSSDSARPSPPDSGKAQHSHVPKAHGATISGNKVVQDPSPTSKQSGHPQPQVQKAQNHGPTSAKGPILFPLSLAGPRHSGNNTNRNDSPKVDVPTTPAQHPARGGQPSASGDAQGSQKPSQKHQQQQQNKPAPAKAIHMRETPSQGHKDTPRKPSTNEGKPPTDGVMSNLLSFFSTGSEAPGNKAPHVQQGKGSGPPQSRPAQETHKKGDKITPTKATNNRDQGNSRSEGLLPQSLTSFFSAESKGSGNPSQKPPQEHRAPPHSRVVQPVVANKDHAKAPPTQMNDRQPPGRFPVESVQAPPKVSASNDPSGLNGTAKRSPNPGTQKSDALPTQDTTKQVPNVPKGSANVSKAAAAEPQTWGQMFSSWLSPWSSSAPVDVHSANKSTPGSTKETRRVPDTAKDVRSKYSPQAAPAVSSVPREHVKKEPILSTKGAKNEDGRSKSSPAPVYFIHHERVKKEPISSTQGPKNETQEVPNASKNSNTSSPPTLPKKDQAPTPAPQLSSSEPGKSEAALNLTSASGHAASQSQTSTSSKPALLRQHAPTMVWRENDAPKVVSAYSTLTAAPLPSPPKNELENKVARKTISKNPELFDVVSPIKVEVFEKYTEDHPNPSFVQSVARGLKEGFWPWADTSDPKFPTTHDGSRQGAPITDENKVNFIRKQRDEELELGRWSKPFGDKLLPGMHAAPISVVPKSTPGKYRLIVDQSRGPHALNSTIAKSQVNVKLDTIHDLGNDLLEVRKKHPNKKLVLFKSDVKSAYRQLPMHPLWQIKQAIPVDGQYHIDRCNTFGNRGGGWNWDSVSSAVNWIATEKKGVSGLLGYVDDNFGWEFARNKTFYKPYKKFMPTKQARLLELWDELGIPHDEDKQLSGPSLPILGFHVDANQMSVRIPDEKKAKVVDLLRNNAQVGKPYTMNELQSMAGYAGNALALYPRLRPGLRVLFDEMSAQEGGTTKMTVTEPVARTLSSLADFLQRAPPVPIQYEKEKVGGFEAGSSKK